VGGESATRKEKGEEMNVGSKNREVSNYAVSYILSSLVLSDENRLLSTLFSIIVTHCCPNVRHTNRNINKHLTVKILGE
jgi:hypothetical protein